MDDHATRIKALIARQPAGPNGGTGMGGFLQRLCAVATKALGVSGAGVSLMAEDGVRRMATASDPATERLEEVQFVLGEGPCIDAFQARRPVLIPDLTDGAMHRWPVYTPTVHDSGVRAVFAFPLQIGASRLGVLDLFRTRPGPLTGEELAQALVFADVAVDTLLDGQERAGPDATADGLAEAMDGRAELFQAQGMVMIQLGIPLAEAMARLRAYAFAEGRPLAAVARDVVARRLRFDKDQP
ncbi:GAF domain-containing protein [Phytohabitans houttuyneae]|uniref:GAF and ANTAR domain-containing protein n=1 Tax=Phytohabitans houttuyneae TaxID=1076126 RepID=UPI0031E684BC